MTTPDYIDGTIKYPGGDIEVYEGGSLVRATTSIELDTVIDDGPGYTFAGGVVTITTDGTYTFTQSSSAATSNRIIVSPGVTANVTLAGVNIVVVTIGDRPFDMAGATVNMTLEKDNLLKNEGNSAALFAPAGAVLTITAASSGSLSATALTEFGAAIGGSSNYDGGSITINGGTINATSTNGAGIGGGYSSSGGRSGGNITINGGNVTAVSERGAGIGGGGASTGKGGAGGEISITGGVARASSQRGAGIGGGSGTADFGGDGGSVATTGGTVTATSERGAGIGGGFGGNTGGAGGTVAISGSSTVVTAESTHASRSGYDVGGGSFQTSS